MGKSKATITYTWATVIFIAIKYLSGLIGDNFSYYPAAPFVTNACYIIAFILAGVSLIMSIADVAAGRAGLLATLVKYAFMSIMVLLLFYATIGLFTTFLLVCFVISAVVAFV